MFRADLHCHCTCSDGTLTPREVIAHASKIGLQGLSITDHDTMQAYDTAIEAAQDYGIRLGSGIELSCDFENLHIHVLGYDYDLKNPLMHAVCKRHTERRLLRNREILGKLQKKGMRITEEELEKIGEGKSIGRPHIAHLLVQKGYVQSIRQAFDKYIGEGKSCYAPGEPFPIEEGIAALHAARGKAFIAHPHLVAMDPSDWDKLLNLPFDGIECYYGNFPAARAERWLKIAQEKKWLISGGSDFHGDVKPEIELGCSTIDAPAFNKIFQHPLA